MQCRQMVCWHCSCVYAVRRTSTEVAAIVAVLDKLATRASGSRYHLEPQPAAKVRSCVGGHRVASSITTMAFVHPVLCIPRVVCRS
jgi:hypothetical protein